MGIATNLRTLFLRVVCLAVLLVASPYPVYAGLDDCIKAAVQNADPEALELSAEFAINHAQCLPDFVPPTTVPYVALSGSLDTANRTGALDNVGLSFGKRDYNACVAKINPGKQAVKKLAPILKPICSTLKMSCGAFEGPAADEVNANLTEQVPLLALIPCACAAATSGLGIERLEQLIKSAKQCGATLAQVGKALASAAKSVANAGKGALNKGEEIVSDLGCAAGSVVGQGCSKEIPPSGYKSAILYCNPHGGLKQANTGDDPADYSVICNDGSACSSKPGKGASCQTGQEKKKYAEEQAKKDSEQGAKNEVWCPARGDQLKATYNQQCHDNTCKVGIGFVVASFAADCISKNEEKPFPPGPTVGSFPPSSAESWAKYSEKTYVVKLVALVRESVIRDPNANPMTLLEAYDCRPFLGRADQQLCPAGKAYEVCKTIVDKNQLRVCREAKSGQVYTSKLDGDPNADPVAAMDVHRCKPFLGRSNERLCETQAGFDLCKSFADKGTMKKCLYSVSKEIYPAQVEFKPAAKSNLPPAAAAPPSAAPLVVAKPPAAVLTSPPAAPLQLQMRPRLPNAGQQP